MQRTETHTVLEKRFFQQQLFHNHGRHSGPQTSRLLLLGKFLLVRYRLVVRPRMGHTGEHSPDLFRDDAA